MRPTRAGALVAATAAALLLAGRLVGLLELTLVGVAGLSALAFAALRVTRMPAGLTVSRVLTTRRVYAGGDASVELAIRNDGSRATPVLELRDPVGRVRQARVLVAPLAPGTVARARYALPTGRRGVLRVGPLEVGVTDPFGLVQRWREGAVVEELTVLPHVDVIAPLPHTIGDEPLGGRDRRARQITTGGGGDFHGLREYQPGDDLRRVHWASSMRLDSLMVREDELPWQGRATVVLDARRERHDADSIERAVSAAASVVEACARRRFLIRLVVNGGYSSHVADDRAHVDALLERLAVLEPTAERLLVPTLLPLAATGGGAIAVIVGDLEPAEIAALNRARRRFGASVVVCARGVPAPAPLPPYVETGPTFVTAWQRAMSSLRTRAPIGV